MASTQTERAGGAANLHLDMLYARAKAWFADPGDHALVQRMAGTAFAIRITSAAIAFVSQVILARWMGGFEFGVYVYVWTWVLLVGGFADLGFGTTAQRFVAEYAAPQKAALLRGFLRASRWLALAFAGGIGALGLASIWLLAPWLNRHELVPLVLACLCLPPFALTLVQDGIARSFGQVNLALVPPYIVRPLLIVGLMIALQLSAIGSSATLAMACAAIATWATAIGQAILLNRRLERFLAKGQPVRRRKRDKIDNSTAVSDPIGTETDPGAQTGPETRAYACRHWVRTSLPVLLVAGFYLLLTYTDILVLQHFRSPEVVGHYYAATKTLALVAFVYFSVAAATGHKFAEYHLAGDRDRLRTFLLHTVKLTFWPSLAATIVILALGKPFLWLFGPGFVEAYPVMFILALGLLARAAVGPAERLLNMLGEQKSCALVYAGAFAFNVTACLLLVPPFGMYGAAIAMAASLALESLLLFAVTKHRLGLHVFIWT